MAEARVSIGHYPAYVVLLAFCGLVRRLPGWCVWRLARGAALAAYLLDGRHRRRAVSNLDIAFGDTLRPAEKRAIARGSFASLFLTIAELIRIPLVADRITDTVGMITSGTIRHARRRGRGVIFLISHFGNWEIMAHRCVAEGFPLASVARPLKNPLIDAEIRRIRTLNGARTLEKKWVAREIIETLSRNGCVAILMDQYAGREAPFVPFFGRPVSTTPAAALLALKTGAALIPVFNERRAPGRHRMHVCDPIPVSPTGDRRRDVAGICARYNRLLEEWVRRHPDQWLWMHRRWRRKKGAGEP
ncbi:MAG: lysophospholipid acyltransferase family protein [bacterium]|nr:lysophospholipid acyltransferase family protein [bacterium]